MRAVLCRTDPSLCMVGSQQIPLQGRGAWELVGRGRERGVPRTSALKMILEAELWEDSTWVAAGPHSVEGPTSFHI